MSRVQHLVVEEGDGDQRLDRWFKRTFPLIGQGPVSYTHLTLPTIE